MPKKRVTIADIAKKCNTSTVTVSKALCGRSGVSEEVRAYIRKTAVEMGYVSTKSAGVKPEGVVGVLIPDRFINPNGSFYWALYNNILALLKSAGFSCVQENIGSDEEASLAVPKMFANNRIIGVISLGQLSREYITMLKEHNRNLVLLDYYLNGMSVDSVVTNGFFGGYKLAEYLISLGHRSIGFIGTIKSTSSIMDRFMGYVKAMLEHNLEIDPKFIIPDRTENGITFDTLDFPEKLPTAFVCNCDETAYLAIRELRTRGISVPGDVSIVGYDNYLISEISEPQITTIQVDSLEMAKTAVNILFERIGSPESPAGIHILDGQLVEKESARKI